MKKILTTIFPIFFIGFTVAQDPADLAQSEAIQEAQESIDQNEAEDSPAFPAEVLAEMVEERLDRKGKILNEVNDDGSVYMIGAASTIKAMNQSGFITSRRIAFEKAELQAKIDIIRLSGETITSERGMETLEQFTDGIDPDLTKKATFMQKLMTVADKSADAALKLLGYILNSGVYRIGAILVSSFGIIDRDKDKDINISLYDDGSSHDFQLGRSAGLLGMPIDLNIKKL